MSLGKNNCEALLSIREGGKEYEVECMCSDSKKTIKFPQMRLSFNGKEKLVLWDSRCQKVANFSSPLTAAYSKI